MDERIGYLVIESKLGEGGMGVVYRARDTRLDRAVAVKVLPDTLSTDPDAMARFSREARLLASLNHPNIASIYGLETAEDKTMLVLELVEGRTLYQVLSDGQLGYLESLDICRQICAGLECAHAAGVIHRDLKPGNVMVTADGRVKLLDFGLARRDESRDGADGTRDPEARTRVGVMLGSPGYMSPEQVMGARADLRTDLWGLGCILFECLSGQRAFHGEGEIDAIQAVLYNDVDLTLLPPDTPATIQHTIAACLERIIARRPASAARVRQILEAELAGSSTGRRTETSTPTTIMQIAGPHNLAEEITSFIGRAAESEMLQEKLREARLLTLTGAGGCGKSRLAQRLARSQIPDHTGGLWVIDVAAAADSESMLQSISDTLGVRGDGSGTSTALELIARHLRHERVLLVLDNCEHLLPAVTTIVSRLLESCGKLRILITSREFLGVTGELVHRVSSLSVPTEHASLDPEDLRGYEFVQLFLDRGRLVNPELALREDNAADVAAICRRLDGIPLALELAAARCRMLSVDQIVARLDDAFRLLKSGKGTRGAGTRQQTLEAVISWSYEHLSPSEQELFCKLSIFEDGWELTAATAICGDDDLDEFDLLDLLEELVKKSLVQIIEAPRGRPRYRLLQTVRQFARTRLLAGGESGIVSDQTVEQLRDRHCRHYLDIAIGASNRYYGEEQAQLLETLERDHGNIHQALEHRLGQADGGTECLCAAAALAPFWQYKSRASAGVGFLKRTIAHPSAQTRNEQRRICLNYLAYLATRSRRFAIARTAVDESCDIAAETGDPGTLASSLHYCGELALNLNNYAEAEEIYTRNLEILRALADPRRIAACLQNLGAVKTDLGKLDEARTVYEEARGINRELGNRGWEAYNTHGLGSIAEAAGDLEDAANHYEQALHVFRELEEHDLISETLHHLGTLALVQGDFERARKLQKEALSLIGRCENRLVEAGIQRELAEQAMAEDEHERARAHLVRALAACASTDLEQPDRRVLRCLVSASRLLAATAAPVEAESLRGGAAAVADALEKAEGPRALAKEAIDRSDTGWRLPPEPLTEAWKRGLSQDTQEMVSRARSLLSGTRRPV